jgi:sec-independent protein translocase protein TatA
MGNLGFQELLIIGIVILVMFGGRKIPEFNDAKNNVKKEIEEGIKEKDDKAS